MTDAQVYASAALIGTVAGMRSMAAPAAVSRLSQPGTPGSSGLDIASCPAVANAFGVFAAAEAIADKLPFMPNRTETFSVVARACSGGISGAVLCSSRRRSAWFGALLGAAAAIGTTYAAYELRRRAKKALHVPDALIAVAEDSLAASTACLVLSRLQASRAAAAA